VGLSGQEARELDDEDQPIPGLSLTRIEHHSGPLPHFSTLQGYEAVMPGLADRIVRMSEATLQADIDSDLIPIRAEAAALKMATFAISFFPWLAVAAALVLLVAGQDAAGVIVGAVGLLSAGPQIIQATRRPRPPATKKDA